MAKKEIREYPNSSIVNFSESFRGSKGFIVMHLSNYSFIAYMEFDVHTSIIILNREKELNSRFAQAMLLLLLKELPNDKSIMIKGVLSKDENFLEIREIKLHPYTFTFK